MTSFQKLLGDLDKMIVANFGEIVELFQNFLRIFAFILSYKIIISYQLYCLKSLYTYIVELILLRFSYSLKIRQLTPFVILMRRRHLDDIFCVSQTCHNEEGEQYTIDCQHGPDWKHAPLYISTTTHHTKNTYPPPQHTIRPMALTLYT